MTAAFPPPPDRVKVRRALLSASDKTGVVQAGRALASLGVELVSTGGTARALAEAGLTVRDVSELTGFPEMMDGRVKTLHPAVHGGLLAVRDAPAHAKAAAEHDIRYIDFLYIDLYPFETAAIASTDPAEVIEQIDIGGPAMIRSGAKNHGYVAVCSDRRSLMDVVVRLLENDGETTLHYRRELAAAAFRRTAFYDLAIAGWFATHTGGGKAATIAGTLIEHLRYGENPHQTASFYRAPGGERPGVASARLISGKPLSYNNIADADAAFELVAEFDRGTSAVAVVKHANPCGVAVADSLAHAYRRALECDPVSAFGGVVALNQALDAATAEAIVQVFTEVIIAPEASDDAVDVVRSRKNLRLLLTRDLPDPAAPGEVFRSVAGGFLVQGRDTARITAADLRIVTRRRPTDAEIADMLFAFTVAKHVKSNAVVYARDGRTLGVGAGQMNRRDSARIAAMRARDFGLDLTGCACASEAFFPFADGLIEAVEAGATAVIQPGGSIRDAEVIAAADARGVAMAFTGVRVFRH